MSKRKLFFIVAMCAGTVCTIIEFSNGGLFGMSPTTVTIIGLVCGAICVLWLISEVYFLFYKKIPPSNQDKQ